jgi:hypothetical protein
VTIVRNPKAEASERLGGRYEVRVLEPSPPAVDDGEFFADDAARRGEAPPGALVVGPTTGSDLTWDGLCAGDPGLSAWCAGRWLGSWRRLPPLPPTLTATRESLRRLACYVLAPARKAANGKIGLRYTYAGFGTPFYGKNEQLRVVGAQLVRQQGGEASAEDITTLEAAAAFAGISLSDDPGVGPDPPGLGDPGAPLAVDEAASGALGEWFGFATSVLEQLRVELDAAGETASRVQLWPEHFDLGMNIEGLNFGCSSGDGDYPEPYVYVGPWDRTGLSGDYWNAPFGALLAYADLLACADSSGDTPLPPSQRLAALTFLRHGAALSRG